MGSGPPLVTLWSGAPRTFEFLSVVVVVPAFWSFAAFSLSAMAWSLVDRRRPALATLALGLAAHVSLWIAGTRILPGKPPAALWMARGDSGPETAFYVAMAANALAMAALVFSPGPASPPPGRP